MNFMKELCGRHFCFKWTYIRTYQTEQKKKKKMSSFKSNENIHKKEDGSSYVVSGNKASSVTL